MDPGRPSRSSRTWTGAPATGGWYRGLFRWSQCRPSHRLCRRPPPGPAESPSPERSSARSAGIGRSIALPESVPPSFATLPLAPGGSQPATQFLRLGGHTVPGARSIAPLFHPPGNAPRQSHTPACLDRRVATAMAQSGRGRSFAPPRTFRIVAVGPLAQRAILARRRLPPQPSQAVIGRLR